MLFEMKEDIKSIKQVLQENIINNHSELVRYSTVNTEIIPKKAFKSIDKLFTFDDKLNDQETKKQMVNFQKFV